MGQQSFKISEEKLKKNLIRESKKKKKKKKKITV